MNVGRQEFQKGQQYLLEAVEQLSASRSGLVVLMAGRRGLASRELDRLRAQPGVGDAVRFLGHREDVPDLLAGADLFVFPSVIEGLGGSLIEAMALGLPIVASDLPAIREVVEEGGNAVLVPPGSPRDLAAAIEQLLEDRPRALAMGVRSRQIFEERFTLENSTAAMIELYERLREGGRSRIRSDRARAGGSGDGMDAFSRPASRDPGRKPWLLVNRR